MALQIFDRFPRRGLAPNILPMTVFAARRLNKFDARQVAIAGQTPSLRG
jgi:hypothetical protein